MNKKMTIVGGDLRNVNLAKMFAKDGIEVSIYGLESTELIEEYPKIKQYLNIKDAIYQSSIIIGPTPFSKKFEDIDFLFCKEKLTVQEFIKNITKDKTLIAGSIHDNYIKEIENNNGKAIDILKNEELAILNAVSTVEGAVNIIIQKIDRNIHGSNILILGFGRLGKTLAKTLKGMGAKVYCASRKNEDFAWMKIYGYNQTNINDMDNSLNKFDIIVNTIPSLVLDKTRLEKIKKECFIIDLASSPGGVDRNVVHDKNINFVWALALPGKVSPVSTAEIMKETIYHIIGK